MKRLLFVAFSLILYSKFAFTQSVKLDTQEVKALREIWLNLRLDGKRKWDFYKDPCSGEGGWGFGVVKKGSVDVECDCSFESDTICHITGLLITSQNVSSALPSEFSKFLYLQVLDLNRNYISGTIPSKWATMRLNTLSIMGNRLSGPFPQALTRMTTLLDLSIEGNHFSGHLPREIANLKNLERLVLSSNDFTGQLSVALARLINLTELRISDNNFTGKIPSFIREWTQIGTLHIQGCSFEGPFPSGESVT